MQQKNCEIKHTSMRTAMTGLFLSCLLISGCRKNDSPPLPPGKGSIENIKHVVVIYLENHSFDNLYGQFSGGNGLQNARPSNTTQVDSSGNPYTFLPPVSGTLAFPTNLPNTFFNIDQYVPNDQMTPDVLHRYYQEQLQIDGGKMDKYALYNTSAGLSQGSTKHGDPEHAYPESSFHLLQEKVMLIIPNTKP